MLRTHYSHRKEPARQLRRQDTEAERELWAYLRNRRFGGRKFRKQVPIGPYFADFVCLELGIVIEVDGRYHLKQQDADENRTHYFKEQGLQVMRFWNEDVLNNIDAVCESIEQATSAPLRQERGNRGEA